MLLHPIRSGFSSRSSVVLLNAVPELPPPELATVSLPLLSSRSVRPLLAVFFALLFPTAAVVRRHEVGANGERPVDRWTKEHVAAVGR